MLLAECESLAHGFAHEAGAFAVVRWHQLSGGSLALTQYTGGRVTIRGGTQALIGAIAGGARSRRGWRRRSRRRADGRRASR